MASEHQNVPAGTVADYEGQPRTVLRDYDSAVFPAMTLTLAALDELMEDVLPVLRKQIAAYVASVGEDDVSDADAPGQVPPVAEAPASDAGEYSEAPCTHHARLNDDVLTCAEPDGHDNAGWHYDPVADATWQPVAIGPAAPRIMPGRPSGIWDPWHAR